MRKTAIIIFVLFFLSLFSYKTFGDTLKYCTVTSFCLSQVMSGVTEGYNQYVLWGADKHVVNGDNYHLFKTLERLGWMSAGICSYKLIDRPNVTIRKKIKIIIGSTLLSRDFNEWAYRWQRYGDPFTYKEVRSRYSVVYFGIRNGKIQDLYIKGDGKKGALIDIGFFLLGLWLLK
jgi:hypothetical protein